MFVPGSIGRFQDREEDADVPCLLSLLVFSGNIGVL